MYLHEEIPGNINNEGKREGRDEGMSTGHHLAEEGRNSWFSSTVNVLLTQD